jgi:hypothetical protein
MRKHSAFLAAAILLVSSGIASAQGQAPTGQRRQARTLEVKAIHEDLA